MKHLILPQSTLTGTTRGRDTPIQPTGGTVLLLKTFYSQTDLILTVQTQRDTRMLVLLSFEKYKCYFRLLLL